MASQNNNEGKLMVKRGRMKRNSRINLNAKMQPELEVGNVEGDMHTKQRSGREEMNLSEELSGICEPLGEKLEKIDNVDEQMDKHVDVTENVAKTLGSAEFPIDAELAADFEEVTDELSTVLGENFEDVAGELSAELAGNCANVANEPSANLEVGNLGLSGSSRRPGDDASVDNNAVASEQSEALAENLQAREPFEPTQLADDAENSLVEVQGKERSQNDNDQVLETEHETQPKKRGRGRPKKKGKKSPGELREELLTLLPEPGESTFSKEVSQKLRLLLKIEKKLPCPREGCDKFYSHLTGFQYHVLRCGASVAISFKCDQCEMVYASAQGLAYHTSTAHKKKNATDKVSEDKSKGDGKYSFRDRPQSNRIDTVVTEGSEDAGDGAKNSRESAQEAEYVMSGSESSGEERSQVSRQSIRSKGWMKYWEILAEDKEPIDPVLKAKFSNLSSISEILKEKPTLICPYKCGRFFKVPANAYKHIKTCNVKQEKHRCKLCGKILLSRYGMKSHIVVKHRRKAHNSEKDEESEFSETETAKGPRQTRAKADHENKTRAWYDAFIGKTVLTSWRPSVKHWKRLPVSEMEDYLPVRKLSPVFRIETVAKENRSPEQAIEHQLPLFTSALVDSGDQSNVVFNAGGSVWAMDWAPVPVDEENCDQYLAIGCHSDPEKKHLVSEKYQEKGVLQIWRIPNLKNGQGPIEKPEFCLGIAYDYGPLWNIRWRPSGAWDASSTQTGELRRLGMLALACADGRLRIFSVPFPCSLVKNDDCDGEKSPEDLLYLATPHVELSPGSLCRKYQNECGPAWSVSWQPIAHGHNKVIASYADGTVAIWDLKTKNRILRTTTPDGLTECIYPISHFQAHNSVVRTLAWCPNEPNYIATGGYDKLVKVWDLRQTSQPVACLAQVFWSYGLSWPLHWPLLIFNTDTTYNKSGTRYWDFHKSCRGKTVGHASASYINHNSAGWDNDCSDWANIIASVDAAGLISVNLLTEPLPKYVHKMKKTLFRAVVEPVVQPQQQTTAGQDIQNEGTSNRTEKEDGFKIVFKDAHPLSYGTAEEEAMFNDAAYISLSQPTHAALQKVRWNPNFSSYQWLAVAGRFGLVRLCYVEKFKS